MTILDLTLADDWTSLDEAARVNLTGSQYLDQFFRYKAQLQTEGHVWKNDAELILRGFIWDALEIIEGGKNDA